AQSIHNYSSRYKAPFVAINCASFPESLLESELFGYEEGAFTGAKKNGRIGLIEAAHTGTLFLDEIGDMPLHLQTRFLRVLQERQINRLGSVVSH
ncbi:sigma 54-interacting transcriptional regulator, partial [Acinetobacter baumannii]